MSILGMLGYDWPTSDEEKLFHLGQLWVEFAPKMEAAGAAALASASAYWENNQGEAAQAFQAWWNGTDSPANTLAQGIPGASLVGAGIMVCAGVVLALKIQVIVQLAILAVQIAQAIATAAVTFGASLLEIPVFKMITSMILDQLIGMAVEAVLNG
ncbi:WXG100-like domain-containing protein [Micromonospora chersina]|uniref:WXG100-like domain-containing protein n=1 Tax=Micromonospora chersina TaxID=47854 RepID=UPI003715DA88